MGTGEVLFWPKWARILAITLASVMAAIHLRRDRHSPQRRTSTAKTLAINSGKECCRDGVGVGGMNSVRLTRVR